MKHTKRNAKGAGCPVVLTMSAQDRDPVVQVLIRSGISLSFYFQHKMFVAANIKFLGVLIKCKSRTSSCNAYLHPRV